MLKTEEKETGIDKFMSNGLLLNAGLLVLAFLIRLVFAAFSDNFPGVQPMLNIITALHIFSVPDFFDNIFLSPLPLYLYSLWMAIMLGSEQILAARFLSLFFGSITILIFYRLVGGFYAKKTALFCAVLLCFFPAHVMSSAISSADAMTLFLLLAALLLIREGRIAAAAGGCLAATACSYMAWVVIPVFALIVFLREGISLKARAAGMLYFTVIAFSFSAGWIFLTEEKFADFGIFHGNFRSYDSFYSFAFFRTTYLVERLRSMADGMLPLFFALSLLGIAGNLREKKARVFILVLGLTLLFSSVNIFRPGLITPLESELFIGVFLLVFLVLGSGLAARCAGKHKNAVMTAVLAAVVIGFSVRCFFSVPRLPEGAKECAAWLKDNLTVDSRVLIHPDPLGSYAAVIMYSGLPQNIFRLCSEDGAGRLIFPEKADCLILDARDNGRVPDGYESAAAIGNFRVYKKKI